MKRTSLSFFLLCAFALAQKYPNAIPTRQDLPFADNNAQTQLTGTITANSRSFTVLDPQKFSKPTYVTISGPAPDYANREIVLICDIQGNTMFACPNGRGVDPKMPPAYHKYGDIVAGLITAEYVNHLTLEVIAQATTLGINLANVIKTNQAAGGDLEGPYPNPFVKTVGHGKALPHGDIVGTDDEQLLTNKTVTGTFYGPLHGTADIASVAIQFSAKPSGCPVGNYSWDIAANGALTCKQIAWTEITGKPTSMPPSGPATGDLTGFYPNPTIASVGGRTPIQIANTVDIVSLATENNVTGTIVKRSNSGNVAAATFTGDLLGNASTATQLQTPPTVCAAGKVANSIDAKGNLGCILMDFSQANGKLDPTQLPDSGATATSYGSGTQIPVLNVDRYGRIVSASLAAIDIQAYRQVLTNGTTLPKRTNLNFTNGLTLADDSAGGITSVGLSNTGVTAKSYGDETHSVKINVAADGRILSVQELIIPGTDGSGYVTVKNNTISLPQRNVLATGAGLFATDDSVGKITNIALAASGVSAGAYGNSGSALSINVDTYGRLLSVSSAPISIAASQISSGTIDNTRLNASSTNSVNTLVMRDNGGNFSAGTITATTFVGNLTGTASSASSVAWTAITGKPGLALTDGGSYNLSVTGSAGSVAFGNITGRPNWLSSSNFTQSSGGYNQFLPSGFYDGNNTGGAPEAGALWSGDLRVDHSGASAGTNYGWDISVADWTSNIPRLYARTFQPGAYNTWYRIPVADGGTYNLSINGRAGTAGTADTANSIAWANITGKPANIVFNDGGVWSINVTGSAGSVAWGNVVGRPGNFVLNDGATYAINITGNSNTASSATSASRWTGSHQIDFAFGDGTEPLYAMTTPIRVWRATAAGANVTTIVCKVDTGTAQVNFYGQSGQLMATASCGSGDTVVSANGWGYLPGGHGAAFQITSVSGNPTGLSVSMVYDPLY